MKYYLIGQKRKFIATLMVMASFFTMMSYAQEVIPMKKETGGLYTVPCEVNGLRLRFIFDTGASYVSISLTEASFMLKNGYLDDDDIIGTTNVQTANGDIAENYVINLKNVKIGTVTLKNVEAVVSSGIDAPLLLGQSVLDKLGHWSINDGKLILNDKADLSSTKFYDFESLESYCNKLVSDGKNEDAIIAISNYINWPDVKSSMLFFSAWPMGNYSKSSLSDQCIDYILTHQFDDSYEEFECLSKVAWFYAYRLGDKDKGTQILERLARNEKYSKGFRWPAYHDLVILHYFEDKRKAIAYAKEAVDNGMYELANTYGEYLIENGRTTEAFNLHKLGHQNGVWTSTYELGVGYIENKWPEKNREKGFALLTKLMKEEYNDDAASYLCDYYIDNGNYDKIIECLPYFTVKPVKNTYGGIAYFKKGDYSYARQQLEDGINFGRSDVIAMRFGYLGEIYEKGLGGIVDADKAYENYLELLKYDPAWGYEMLGDMFLFNELIQSDPEQAYQYYILGANNGSGYSCFMLAQMNYLGIGTSKSMVKAKDYKDKAIKQGFKSTDFDF